MVEVFNPKGRADSVRIKKKLLSLVWLTAASSQPIGLLSLDAHLDSYPWKTKAQLLLTFMEFAEICSSHADRFSFFLPFFPKKIILRAFMKTND